jgi:hypothetical protein
MAPTAKIRIDSQTDRQLRRLAVVFADPIRLKIVTALFQREMSPSLFHATYGGGTLSRVDKHFKRLAEYGWLRLVRSESGKGRRGAVENFYRAPELAVFDAETWARLPRSLREEFSWRIFEQFAERVREALDAGTFDAREDRHFTWTPLVLDEQGRKRVLALVDDLFDRLPEEQTDARIRCEHTGEALMSVTVGLAAFDSPKAERNREDLLLAFSPKVDAYLDDEAFTMRLARIFSNETDLKIVTELCLRELSPSGFAREFGYEDIDKIFRRFRALAEQGWLVKLRQATGGARRGARENFYRATEPAIFDARGWSRLPEDDRTTYSWRIFRQLAEQVREAMDAHTFDSQLDRHHTWIELFLDERGWNQVIKAMDAVFYEILDEGERAKQRLQHSTEEPAIATVYLAAFESPRPLPLHS